MATTLLILNQSDAQMRQIHIKVVGATQAQISKQLKLQKPEIQERQHIRRKHTHVHVSSMFHATV